MDGVIDSKDIADCVMAYFKKIFSTNSLPFIYLGVPLFKGKRNMILLQPIADRLINKLVSWKGSLLSFVGRVELVKSSIVGMLTHNMIAYAWSLSLIADIKRAVKIFIWSGDTSK